MKKTLKLIFKIVLFVINIGLGVVAMFYLVLKFKTKRKTKNDQLKLIEDDSDSQGADEFKKMISQSKRTEEVYRLIREMKTVDMTYLLSKIKGVTERTLRRDLAKLQTMRLIKKSGNTKSAKYSVSK